MLKLFVILRSWDKPDYITVAPILSLWLKIYSSSTSCIVPGTSSFLYFFSVSDFNFFCFLGCSFWAASCVVFSPFLCIFRPRESIDHKLRAYQNPQWEFYDANGLCLWIRVNQDYSCSSREIRFMSIIEQQRLTEVLRGAGVGSRLSWSRALLTGDALLKFELSGPRRSNR